MLDRFLKYIHEERLCQAGDRILLGISGGMDSMLMASLFSQSPFNIGIAHCNFGLRGQESDEDEQFVARLAQDHSVPFHLRHFDTAEYARRRKISVQMAARELRYEWFDSVRRQEHYQRVAVAHHLNDLVETMLINLVRGTGPDGLHGILPRNGDLIRPLLCFTRQEIADEMNYRKLPYREESSNASDKYMRNRLRHQVVPVLKDLNPSLEHSFSHTAHLFLETGQVLRSYVDAHRHLLQEQKESWEISCEALLQTDAPQLLLYHLLRPMGFHPDTVRDLLKACRSQPGKQFLSPTHTAIKDRGRLVIIPREDLAARDSQSATGSPETSSQVRRPAGSLQRPAPAFEEIFDTRVIDAESAEIMQEAGIVYLDYATLNFPLKTRFWQEGDRFRPLGMKGQKKLSDFFVDQKVPLHLKRRIPLVLSGDEIAWVAGYRIGDPFKVTGATEKVLEVRFKLSKNKLNLG